MTNEDELNALRAEVKRLRVEVKLYKEKCENLCDVAEEFSSVTVSYLRGRPGREHPTSIVWRKMDRTIEHTRNLHIFVDAITKDR